jgi:ABC-2 type transport system ATP-binding protein
VEQYLTVAEAIELYRNMYPHPRDLDEIVELVQLKEKRNVRVNRLSGGQRRRLDVGVALAGDPDVLFLDEPTEGFDPSARRNAWQIIKDLASLGKTIFLTTHYMDEAEYLADRLAIIANGRIVAEGTPKNLGGRQDEQSTIRFRAIKNSPNLPKDLAMSAKTSGDFIELVTKKSVESLNTLTGWAIKNNLKLESLEVSQPSLEDVYLKITSQARAKNG